MFEKLLLAAALTLSLQIFAGASTSTKFPKTYVFRANQTLTQVLKLPLVAVPTLAESEI
jgi:hypothetical protein